jgi:hypothetical protein
MLLDHPSAILKRLRHVGVGDTYGNWERADDPLCMMVTTCGLDSLGDPPVEQCGDVIRAAHGPALNQRWNDALEVEVPPFRVTEG